jgi:L-galactose dehydrogenase
MLRKAIGLGTAGFGNVYGARQLDSLRRTIGLAFSKGITYFDTAPYYNNSEHVLGGLLKPFQRNSFVISTKIGRYHDSKLPDGYFDFSRRKTINSVHESCRRLNTTHLDIVHCHDIEYADPRQLIHETIPVLVEMKHAGIIKTIGLSGYPLIAFTELLKNSYVARNVGTVTTYSNYTLQNRSLISHDLTVLAKRNEIKLVNAGILGMGLLTQNGPQTWHPASPKLKETAILASNYCADNGVDIANLATKFALNNNDQIDITVLGAYSPEELQAVLNEDKPNDKLMEGVTNIFRKAGCVDTLWGPSKNHFCYYNF